MATCPPNKPDPSAQVFCTECRWNGKVSDAICKPNDLVRCPKCGRPVDRAHYKFTKSEPVRTGISLSLGEAKLVAEQIRHSTSVDREYWPFVIEELVRMLERGTPEPFVKLEG